MDKNIDILQLIKNGDIIIKNQISHLKAKKEINIFVQQFFINSPDMEAIKKQVDEAHISLKKEKKEKDRTILLKKINSLIALENEFKIQVLHMADFFSRINLNTKRIIKAMDLFRKGKFIMADKELSEIDLSDDQFNLLLQVEYLEQIRDNY